jgi:hypothetical protein
MQLLGFLVGNAEVPSMKRGKDKVGADDGLITDQRQGKLLFEIVLPGQT